MSVQRLSTTVRKALRECETFEDVAQVWEAIKAAGPGAIDQRPPVDPGAVRVWAGLPPKREPLGHFEDLGRSGAIDTTSMMFRPLRQAAKERGRIEKNAFHPRRVKDEIRRRHAELLREARAFRSFPDFRRVPS